MTDNKYLAWVSFTLFLLSIAMILVLFVAAALSNVIENPEIFVLIIGAFSFMAAIMGFLSFRAPQAKVGGVGGLVLLLLALFVVPVSRESNVSSPLPETSFQEKTGRAGIAELDHIIDIVLSRDLEAEKQLLQFSTLACTHKEGLGGPPKCLENEKEGTLVDVFPFLGPEGHHMRQSELDSWDGIQVSDVYAVYRNSKQVYSDEAYPAGEYAIIFANNSEDFYQTLQVTDGKIVRIDNNFGNAANINLEQVASEIILSP